MKKTKWQRPICDDQMLGINPVIIAAIKKNDHSGVFGNEAFVKTKVIIHSYREIGTALEVCLESHWMIEGLPTIIKFKTVVV